ncbi:cation:proton antiporter [Streptomyces sp. NPDC005356]|uniref:cation:proton antiporter domain-containing protein n=1 Tax=Streptomyces sp. NPDC005356 TaxID=3157167 RepID=UPI0033B6DF0B
MGTKRAQPHPGPGRRILLPHLTHLTHLRSTRQAISVSTVLYAAAVGGVVGLVLGVTTGWIRARMDDANLAATLNLTVPFAAYLIAAHLDASDIVAVVLAAFAVATAADYPGDPRRRPLPYPTRLKERELWPLPPHRHTPLRKSKGGHGMAARGLRVGALGELSDSLGLKPSPVSDTDLARAREKAAQIEAQMVSAVPFRPARPGEIVWLVLLGEFRRVTGGRCRSPDRRPDSGAGVGHLRARRRAGPRPGSRASRRIGG